ncbi:MAG: DUF4286 family protein [Gammaproteobacteria bacterium]|nr:DUF4286 family protein [Gammaproteobacteria bacterium]MBU2678481.1 DUF4286 family protein [Gammaproteobacteria bacterium]NNC57313.1 DUF4286 family protein [Woeseiaceae bacterium]NNL52216.1 DUF4286 family protein [Woeseiaceae bacterium]
MTNRTGPLYELTFSVDSISVTEFERWLEELRARSLQEQGIADARFFPVGDDTGGNPAWTCQFLCIDDSAIDKLLDGYFAEIDAAVALEFGDTVGVSSRTLREDTDQELPPVQSPDCLNCGTRLRGQYCGVCGQRARNRLISLWELVSDAFGDLFEIDSRLWRTLIPLLARPGRLTRDYLEGRRARYMPPFRTYLVLSVIFFVVAFFDPRDDLSLLFEPAPEPTPEAAAEKAAAAESARQEILDELAQEGIITDGAILDEDLEESSDTVESGLNFQFDDETGECIIDDAGFAEMPQWLQRRLTRERAKRVCERIAADSGKTFSDLLLDNIPVALIVLLPLMALVLKILYPLSRRYFVEHLLFVIHYHAFFFLILTLQILFSRLTGLLRVMDAAAILVIVATALYIPVYLYMAMRRVYGQGRILTFTKYVVLVACYGIGATVTMLGAVLFALVAV